MHNRFIFALVMLVCAALMLVPAAAQQAFEPMAVTAESCDYGGIIQSIEAIDELTVQFTLCQPDPAFPSKAALPAFGILPSEVLQQTGGGGPELFQNPIGTGPYMLEEWDQGNEIVFTRFDGYWGEPANEQTLIFRWNSDAAARLAELQAGNADGIDNPGPDDFPAITEDTTLQLLEREGLNTFYIGFNNTIAPFDSLNVRQALAYAIDKQRIVDNYYPPGSSVADQFMPPAIRSGYTPDVVPFPNDTFMARILLDASSLEFPLEVTLNYRDVDSPYLPNPGIIAQDIADQLEALATAQTDYFNVTVEQMETDGFFDAVNAGELAFYLHGWDADYADATNFLDFHFGDNQNIQFGEKFDDITRPLAEAAQREDLVARNRRYTQANIAIRDFAPMIPVAHGGSGVAYRAGIEGAYSSPLGSERFSVMSDPDDDVFVWVQSAEPVGLYCADEIDGESMQACEQIVESLLAYEIGGTEVIPALAESFAANDDRTIWTFNLRDGVLFHDGSTLDANDVVMSWGIQWDASNPLHVGRVGGFYYFGALFNAFLNAE